MATLFSAEDVWLGRWRRKQQKAWRKQIFELWTWKQVRGPAGAVLCETRDLGVMWPQWHALLFEGQVAVDMRVVRPQDGKKMLLKHARMVHWMEMRSGKKEFAWNHVRLCCGGRPATCGQTRTAMSCESLLWKEDGCRKENTTLVGRIEKGVEAVAKKK